MNAEKAKGDSATVVEKSQLDSAQPKLPGPPAAAAQAGYRIVKVRKPDGTIVQVKRPIPTTTTASAQAPSTAVGEASKDEPAAKSSAAIENPAVKYQIIKVRKPDGTIAKVRRQIEPANTTPTQTTTTGEKAQTQSSNAPTKPLETSSDPKVVATPASKTTAKAPELQISGSTPKEIKPNASAGQGPDASSAVTVERSSKINADQPRKTGLKAPRLGALALRTFATIVPSYNIGEAEDGDEFLTDTDYDSDETYDSEGDDDVYDDYTEEDVANEVHDAAPDEDAESRQSTATAVSNHVIGGATAAAAGLNSVPPTCAQNGNRGDVPASAQNGSGAPLKSNGSASAQRGNGQAKQSPQSKLKPGPSVTEKEIKNDVSDNAAVLETTSTKNMRRLKRYGAEWSRYILYALLIVLPLLFIVLGIITASLKGKPTGTNLGAGVDQAIKIAVTAWPIIFAAIAAQSLRAFATYKVERGIRLMTLEQLINSSSVANSIKQPFVLGRFDLMSIALLCLWALSPLASQALQRMYYPTTQFIPSNSTAFYLNTRDLNYPLSSSFGQDILSIPSISVMKQLFVSALLPRPRGEPDPVDRWLRPRVPIFETLTAPTDSNGWRKASGVFQYASLYGIPYEDLHLTDVDQVFNFTVQSSYLDFNCLFLNRSTIDVINATALDNSVTLRPMVMKDTNRLTSYMGIVPLEPVNLDKQQTGRSTGQVYYASQISSTNFIMVNDTVVDRPYKYSYSICNFTQTFVDVNITCNNYDGQSNLCQANSVRESRDKHNVTQMTDFSEAFLDAVNPYLDAYLAFPTNYSSWLDNVGTFSVDQVGLDNFTSRLSLVMNTYWQLGYGAVLTNNGLNHTIDYLKEPNAAIISNTTMQVLTPQSVYGISIGWLAALFICSGLLMVASIVSIICDMQALVPDILGFVSSVARKSKYVDLPKTDSTMSGPERARLLGDVKVMMQDVKPAAPVGRIALGTAHESAQRLRPGRDYR